MPSELVGLSRAERDLRKTFVQTCHEIATVPIDELTQIEKYGIEGGFEVLRPVFQKTILLFSKLETASLDLASETKLQSLSSIASGIQQRLNQMRSYSPQGPMPLQERGNRIQDFLQTYDKACDEIGKFIGLSQLTDDHPSEDEAGTILDVLRQLRASAEKQVAETLSVVQNVAKKAGIAEYAHLFQNEADEHRRTATRWLFVTVGLLLATFGFALWNYTKTYSAITTTATTSPSPLQSGAAPTVQFAIAKLILFSVFFSATIWAARIYRANRHNYVINKHRQNALSTFEVFVKAASADDQTKNAVLLQATQCIFSSQNTGYIGLADKEGEGQPQILEIIRSISSKP